MRKPCVESNGRSFTGRVYISAPQVCTRCTRSSTSTRDQLRGAKRRVITQRAHSLCFASARHDTVLAPLRNKYIYIFDSRFTFTSLETSLLSTENFQNFQHSDNKCNGYISSVSSTVVPQLSGYLYEQETVRIIRRLSHRRAEGRVEGTWEGVFPLISSFLSRSTCRHSSSRTERHLDGGCRTVPEGSCG